jgi:uncharacterized RDD family membrane protein YckC
MNRDHSLGDGVYYDYDAYAGFLRRLVVIMIDMTVLLVVGVMLWFPILVLAVLWDPEASPDPSGIVFLLWAAIIWFYLTVIKRSRWRTVGYRMLGLKIVTTHGTRPSLPTMTFRLLMWLFGPFNFILDLIWLGADTEQQSLRDCYSGTYVVRNDAEPIGSAPIHLTRYHGAGLTLVYPRVVRPQLKVDQTSDANLA